LSRKDLPLLFDTDNCSILVPHLIFTCFERRLILLFLILKIFISSDLTPVNMYAYNLHINLQLLANSSYFSLPIPDPNSPQWIRFLSMIRNKEEKLTSSILSKVNPNIDQSNNQIDKNNRLILSHSTLPTFIPSSVRVSLLLKLCSILDTNDNSIDDIPNRATNGIANNLTNVNSNTSVNSAYFSTFSSMLKSLISGTNYIDSSHINSNNNRHLRYCYRLDRSLSFDNRLNISISNELANNFDNKQNSSSVSLSPSPIIPPSSISSSPSPSLSPSLPISPSSKYWLSIGLSELENQLNYNNNNNPSLTGNDSQYYNHALISTLPTVSNSLLRIFDSDSSLIFDHENYIRYSLSIFESLLFSSQMMKFKLKSLSSPYFRHNRKDIANILKENTANLNQNSKDYNNSKEIADNSMESSLIQIKEFDLFCSSDMDCYMYKRFLHNLCLSAYWSVMIREHYNLSSY
jgi:hypothetical protein